MSKKTSRKSFNTKKTARKILLGEALYKECSSEFGMISLTDLDRRLPKLIELGFTHVTIKDLADLCHLKEFPVDRMTKLQEYIVQNNSKIVSQENDLEKIRRSLRIAIVVIYKLLYAKQKLTQPETIKEWQKLWIRSEYNFNKLLEMEQSLI